MELVPAAPIVGGCVRVHVCVHLDVTCAFEVMPGSWLTDSPCCWLTFHPPTLADEVMEWQAVERKGQRALMQVLDSLLGCCLLCFHYLEKMRCRYSWLALPSPLRILWCGRHPVAGVLRRCPKALANIPVDLADDTSPNCHLQWHERPQERPAELSCWPTQPIGPQETIKWLC